MSMVLHNIINDNVKINHPIGGMPIAKIYQLWFFEAHKLREKMKAAGLEQTAHHIAGMIIEQRNMLPNDIRLEMDKL